MRNQQEEVDIDKGMLCYYSLITVQRRSQANAIGCLLTTLVIKRFQELYQRGEWEHTWGRDLVRLSSLLNDAWKADCSALLQSLWEFKSRWIPSHTLTIGPTEVRCQIPKPTSRRWTSWWRALWIRWRLVLLVLLYLLVNRESVDKTIDN